MQNRPLLVAISFIFFLCGCSRAPSVSVLGSFFPAWMICCLVGIVLAVVSYAVFQRVQLHAAIPVPVITYPCLAVLYTFCIWLIFYS